jgi:hypothetical protein
MVDAHECTFWPFLRFLEFYRLYEDNETCHVFPARRRSFELYIAKSASAAWNFAEGGGVYRELNAVLEVVAV